MAFDADLAERVRTALADRENLREVKMFGGLAFMVDNRMVCCVQHSGLLVRVSRERDADYLESPGAERAEMGKARSMGEGWITVADEVLVGDEQLGFWIDAVLDYNAATSRRKSENPR